MGFFYVFLFLGYAFLWPQNFSMEFKLISHGDSSIHLEKWMCARIAKANGSSVIREISRRSRCTHKHLKRVRANRDMLEVLVCPLDAKEDASATLKELGIEDSCTFEVDVPTHVPEIEEERQRACEIWPCVFRPITPETLNHLLLERVAAACKKNMLHQSQSRECADSSLVLERLQGSMGFFSEHPSMSAKPFQHSIVKLVQVVSNVTDGYLCTDRVVLLSNEPCFMCGMALVHSRVKMVFIYGSASADSPYTKHGIHRLKSLNHRFRVYIRAS